MLKTDAIRWPAPAKLNLFLYINGQREDGYHELQTLFQFIDLCDYLTMTANTSGEIVISPDIEGLPMQDNLIFKAATMLKQYGDVNLGVNIHLEKNLPMGGGLGGGSSDAATTLLALNYHWDLNLTRTQLAQIGLSLGADLPIFIAGKASIAEGVGEQLTSVSPLENHYLVATPDCHISTPAVFQNTDLIRNTPKRSLAHLMHQDWLNNCEPVVKNSYPKVAKVIDWLVEYAPTRLTGTGACVFSTFPTAQEAQVVLDKSPSWLTAFSCKGLNTSPVNALLSTLE
ncbi:4-(cytidine 5'-diphospho)-2-C-methyl-D-erythritol kinase [Psychromonas sp. Urea-02u-13]|uniref:4-(cytidine 5'-diphospho)-2-C-methyl-D-erythritol kinase n=1 Tax=Psychromonas sp. Urea-02u-13 TaxID=2058326 RepID=UPI000C34D1F3|nr:4-(cytidine 5'-diphospho)-2-C-methyl-D-erythritol kinase [Psychromonas sp. Urea-02u-13]PKG38389.1 4-(cytidine 5'-diphospho)-2-C-methyl-D-erythritol kinase [Psychromonas sp. Urea-02u-13]